MSCEGSELYEMLKELTAEEQAIIRPVLERDLEFQRREKARVRLLKTSVDLYKSESIVHQSSTYSMPESESSESMTSYQSNISSASPSSPSHRSCCQCSVRLGFIFNAGTRCRKCHLLVCDNCRFYTTKDKKCWLCPICYKERELIAASGEWMGGVTGQPVEVSEILLTQMRRASMDRTHNDTVAPLRQPQRAPAISRRNLTLPEISAPNLLSVPTETEATFQNRGSLMKRFWGGSPSPRTSSPRNMGSPHGVTIIAPTPTPPPHSLMPQMHFKEVIGSPAPRHVSPLGSPLSALDSSLSALPSKGLLPTTEIAPPTPTAVTPSSPLCEMRRQVFQNVERLSGNIPNNNLLRPIDLRETLRRRSCTCEGRDGRRN